MELDESLKNISGDLIDLTKTAQNMQGISIYTDETKNLATAEKEYKSLVQYLGELSDAWDSFSQTQQNDLLQKLFGKTRAQAGAAIIKNFDAVRDALETMENAAGSSDREMSVIESSLSYKLNNLKQIYIGFAEELFSRDDLGKIIDSAAEASEGLTKAVDSLTPALSSLLGIIGDLISALGKFAEVTGGAFPLIAGGFAGLVKYHSNIEQFIHDIGTLGKVIEKVNGVELAFADEDAGLLDKDTIERLSTFLTGSSEEQAQSILSSLGLNEKMQEEIMNRADVTSAITAQEMALQSLTASQIQSRIQAELGTKAEAEALITKMKDCQLLTEQGVATEYLTKANIQEWVSQKQLTEAEAEQIITSLGLAGANEAQTFSLQGLTTAVIANTKAAGANIVAWMAANPVLTMVGLAIAAVGAAFYIAAKKEKEEAERIEEVKNRAKEAKSEISSLKNELKSTTKTVDDISNSYANLAQNIDNLGSVSQSQGSLANEDYEKFLDYSNQLADLFPQLIKGYDDNGNAILDLSGDVDTIVGSLDALIKKEKELTNLQISESLKDVWAGYSVDQEEREKQLDELENRYRAFKALSDEYKKTGKVNGDLLQNMWKYSDEDDQKVFESLGIPNWWLFEESTDELMNIVSKRANDAYGDIQRLNNEITSARVELGSYINSWLSTDIDYGQLSDEMQTVVKDLFSDSSWFDILKKNGVDTSNWDTVKYYFDKNLMDQLEKLDTEEYQEKFSEILKGTVSSVDIGTLIAELKTKEGFDPNNPVVLYLTTQFEESKDQEEAFEKAIHSALGTYEDTIHTIYYEGAQKKFHGDTVGGFKNNSNFEYGQRIIDFDYLKNSIDRSEWNDFAAWVYEQGEKLVELTGEEILKAFNDRNPSEDEAAKLLSTYLSSEDYDSALSNFKSQTDKLTGALKGLYEGTLTDADKIELFEEFPTLADQADDLETALAELTSKGFHDLYKTMKDKGASDTVLKMLRQIYTDALKATDALNGLTRANRKLSDTQKQTSSGLKILGDIYSDVKDGEAFDWSSILNNDDFKNEFGKLDSYNDFVKTVTETPDKLTPAVQKSFDTLVTEYLKYSNIFKDITKNTRKATINYLSDMGIANATEVVDTYLKDMKDYQKKSKEISHAFDDIDTSVKGYDAFGEISQSILENTLELDKNTAALIENKIQTMDLSEVQEEEQGAQQVLINQNVTAIEKLLEEAGATQVVKASVMELIAEQNIFSNQDLGIKQKVSELEKLAEGYGKTLASAKAARELMARADAGETVDLDQIARSYKEVEDEWKRLLSEEAKIDYSNFKVTGYDGVKGNDKDKSDSKSDNYIDWIQRRIDVTNAAIDTLESKYENATSVKGKNSILGEEVEYAKTLLDTYRRAEDYYDNYFNKKVKKYQKQNIGLTDKLIQKVKDGTIQVQDFSKNENLYNALTDLQSWWDLVNESAKGYQETLSQITETEQKAFDNINEKYDKRRERWNTNNSLLEARYNNLTTENLSAKNSNMDKQILKDYQQNEYYRQELADVVARQKNNRATLRKNLAKDTSTDVKVVNKIKSLMKKGKIIPAKIIDQINNDATLASILAYNAGISEVKDAKANYKQSVQDTISEIVSENQSQIDDINAYYDLLQEDIDDTQKKQDAKAANAIQISDKNSFVRKSTTNAENGVKLAEQRKNAIQAETKKDKNKLDKELKKSSLSESDIAKIKECTSSNTKISTDILNKVTNMTLYARMVAYNNDVDALKAARQDYNVKTEELITTKRENAKAQFDNVTTGYEKVISTLSNSLSDIDNEISRIESQGRKVDATFYKAQQEIYGAENKLLAEELTKAQNRLSNALKSGDVQVGTEEYFEMLDAIQNIENEQATMLSNIKAAKDAITEIANEIQSGILDKVHDLVSEVEVITTLLGDNLADETIGGFTEAGLAVLSNAQATALAYKSTQTEVKALLDSMQKAYDKKTLTFIDSNGVERQYASLEELKNAIDEVEDAYEEETKSYYNSVKEITDLMEQRYQAEIGYINNLIDKKKDLLSAEKDLYEYSKNISEQTKNIDSLRKQIAALSGDTSLENQARVQKLQTQLKEAEDSLQETEYDHYIEAQQTMLDNLSAEYQEFIDQHLKDTDSLLKEANTLISENGSIIQNAIDTSAEKFGYSISDLTQSLLGETTAWSEQASVQNQSVIENITSQTTALTTTMREISNEITGAFDALKTSTDEYYKDMNDAYKAVVGRDANISGSSSNETGETSGDGEETVTESKKSSSESKANEKAVLANRIRQILKSGSAFDKNKNYAEFYSILKQNGFTNITNAQMAEIANLVSDSGKTYSASMFNSNSKDYKRYRAALIKKLVELGLLPNTTALQKKWYMTNALQGFAKGGIVKAMKENGDSVLVSARPGEGIMTEQQTQAFLKLVSGQNLNSMNIIAKSLAGLDDKVLSSITNSNIGGTTIDNSGMEFNFVLENVTNAADVMREIQGNAKYQKVLQDLTVNRLSGQTSRLSANKYKI